MSKENRQKGFTLIEVIAVLLIVGILAAFAGLGIVSAVQGYMFSRDNAAISEKTMLAMARINREILECYNCTGTWNIADFKNTLGRRSIQKSGSDIVINNLNVTTGAVIETDKLLDNVALFTPTYNTDKSVTITIQSSTQPGGVTVPEFSTRVYPRNTY